MNKDAPRLIACHWTIAGDQHPLKSNGTSPVPLPDRIRAAAQAGFTGIGFLQSDLAHLLDTYSSGEIARMLDDHGLIDIEVECLADWFTEGERRSASDRMRHLLLEFGAAVGARHMKLMGPIGEHWPTGRLAESFAGVCADAAGSGVRPAIEMLPFSDIATPERVMEIVGGSDGGGIYLDIWHVRHGRVSDESLRAIPIDRLIGIEINDAIADHGRPMYETTIEDRLPPGEGELDPAGFVRLVRDMGFDGPIGVEIISNRHRTLPLDEALRVAFATSAAAVRSAAA